MTITSRCPSIVHKTAARDILRLTHTRAALRFSRESRPSRARRLRAVAQHTLPLHKILEDANLTLTAVVNSWG